MKKSLTVFVFALCSCAGADSLFNTMFQSEFVTFEAVSNIVENAVGSFDSGVVSNIVTGYGYQTPTQVSNIVTGYCYQTSTQVSNIVTGYGYQTPVQVSNIVAGYGYPDLWKADIDGRGFTTTGAVESIFLEKVSGFDFGTDTNEVVDIVSDHGFATTSYVDTAASAAVMSLPIFSESVATGSHVATVAGTAYGLLLADAVSQVTVYTNVSLRMTMPACVTANRTGYQDVSSYGSVWVQFTAYIVFTSDAYDMFCDAVETKDVASVPCTLKMYNTDETSSHFGEIVSLQGYFVHKLVDSAFTEQVVHTGEDYTPGSDSSITVTFPAGSYVWCFAASSGANSHKSLNDAAFRPDGGQSQSFYITVSVEYSVDPLSGEITYYDSADSLRNVSSTQSYAPLRGYLHINDNHTTRTGYTGSNKARYGWYRCMSSLKSRSGTTKTELIPSGGVSKALSANNITNTPIDSVVFRDGQMLYRLSVTNGVLSVVPENGIGL